MDVESGMANESDPNTAAEVVRRQELSALVDGELTSDGVQRICVAWRSEPASRETWHAFQVIGDVMRSEDLARAGTHDERFLRDFRARMSIEPVVLAPHKASASADADVALQMTSSVAPRRSSGRSWRVPTAVAAGLVVVVGVMMATQAPHQTEGDSAPLAALPASISVGVTASAPQVVALVPQSELNPAATELVFDGQVIRDPRLDRYLLAHKQFSGSSVLGAPSGFLRNAAVEVPAR